MSEAKRDTRLFGLSLIAMTLVLAFAASCSAKRAELPESEVAPSSVPTTRATVRSGELLIRAKNLESVKTHVENEIEDVGGWVERWTFSKKLLRMTLRVPESELASKMDAFARLGKVKHRSMDSSDVTEMLIDLEARLANLDGLRDRLRSYLADAGDLKEILEVERELARVQTEIDALEAKLERLRSQVAMSEILLTARRKHWWN